VPASADGLNGIYLVLLYTTVGGSAYRWLIPRLTPDARKLAAVFLAAQILVIILSQTIEPTSTFEKRLWDLRLEWNIPSTLATTQLATVGMISFLLGWLARGKLNWHRPYFAAVGLVFLFLAVDEFFKVHEPITDWYKLYAGAGVLMALISAFFWARSPAAARFWLAWMIGGLGIGAMGGIVLERINRACDGLAFLQIDGCFHFFVWEEAAEFLGIWLALVAMLGFFSELRPPPSGNMRRAILSLPLIWLFLLLLNAMLPRAELALLERKSSVEFERGVRLHGYSLDQSDKDRGRFSARIYLSAKQKRILFLGYSLHLVDQITGKSVAGGNDWMNRQHSIWPLGPDYVQVYRQMIDVVIPPDAPVNRALWVVFSLWHPRGEEYEAWTVLSSDHRLLSESQVALGEIVLQDPSSASTDSTVATFDNDFALAGAELPETARVGETLRITFTWRADSPGKADYNQFLHLGHEASGEWFVYDQNPLGARLPTRLWYSSLSDSETWQVPLPADLQDGSYAVYTGLYHARERERVIARDANGEAYLDSRVPLGSIIVRAS